MAKTMRAKPAWLFRRCRIGNDFPTVLHGEDQRRERERENSRVFAFLRRAAAAGVLRTPRGRTAPKVHWSM